MAGKGITFDLLAQLRASGAQSAGTENGTALTNGPLGLCKAVLSLTSITAGTLTAYLEQSSDNSTFYRVPGSDFRDASDGAVLDAAGQYEVYVDLEQRYVRVVGVLATGPATWACDIAVAK